MAGPKGRGIAAGSIRRGSGGFGRTMAQAKKTTTAPVRRTVRTRAPGSPPMAERVRDLAWAGQHPQAIEQATRALAATGLAVAAQLDLLDLRAESHIAGGDLANAATDAN